jgi:hypothetical protein
MMSKPREPELVIKMKEVNRLADQLLRAYGELYARVSDLHRVQTFADDVARNAPNEGSEASIRFGSGAPAGNRTRT